MKSFKAFFKKELLESVRSGKLLFLSVLFLLFGIMNPGIAKLTPWLLEFLSDSLAENGMTVTGVEVNALTSWTQFFKNIPIALMVFVLVYSNTFTKEYSSGTLLLILTKGVSRDKVVFAKAALMLIFWTAGYFVCFGITYGYNAFWWDNGIAAGLVPAAVNWWLFGVLVVCLTVLFSTLSGSQAGVLLGTGGVIMAFYLAGIFPEVGTFMPTSLMNSQGLLIGAQAADSYIKAAASSALTDILCLGISIPIMNKRQM